MRKIAATLVLFFVAFTLSAQISKGSFLLGGSGSLNFRTNDRFVYTKSTTLNIDPVAGYFIIPNLCAGLSLPLSWATSKSTTTYAPITAYKSATAAYGVGPFIRYYIPVRSFFLVTEASYSWSYTKTTYSNVDPNTGAILGNEYDLKDHIHGYKLAAGPAFFLSRYTSVEILANYQHTSYDEFSESDFFVSIGFQVYLPSGSGKE